MTYTLVATKQDKLRLWHIKSDGETTLCGLVELELPTVVEELPIDTKYMCQECLIHPILKGDKEE